MELRSHQRLMALVQGSIWTVVGAAIGGGLLFSSFAEEGLLGRVPAAAFVLIAPFLTGIIGAVTGPNQARKDFREGKIDLPPEALEKGKDLTPPRRPMWLVPASFAVLFALPFAAAGVAVAMFVFPQGMGRIVMVALAAIVSGGSAALCAFVMSGRETLRYAAHEPAAPLSFGKYTLVEHVSGNSLINIIINAFIGFVLFRQGPLHPGPLVEAREFVPEILAMSAIVAVAVSIGAGVQAAADVMERRVTPFEGPPPKHPGAVARILVLVAMAPVVAGILWGALYVLGLDSISLTSAVIIKALISGVVAAIAVYLAAKWSAAKTAAAN